MKPDTSMRKEYPPRGMALITGEDFISGHSSIARCLGVEIKPEDVDLSKLTIAQENHDKLSKAMTGYLKWLAPMMDTLPKALEKEFIRIRGLVSEINTHGRLIEAIVWLQIGYKMFLKYAVELQIITKEEVKEKLNESLRVLISIVTSMESDLEEEKPEILFINTLQSMLDSGDYILDYSNSGILGSRKEFNKHAKVIGWEGKKAIYLIPEVSYAAVCEVLSKQNKTFPVSLKVLLKSLEQVGLIKTEVEEVKGVKRVKRTIKKTINKQVRPRVIHMYRNKFAEMLGLEKKFDEMLELE